MEGSKIRNIVFAVAVLGGFIPTGAGSAPQAVFGYLEHVFVYPGPFALEAKLDTGADHSSIHANILKREKRDGKDWISFEISNKAGTTAILEMPVHRIAKVRRHAGRVQQRPVVKMEICLGDIRREVQVNLVDRKNHRYRLLIGRSFLAKFGLVDSAARFTTKPNCQ